MTARSSVTGVCRLCLEHGPLTYEHVPPRKAFNSQRVAVYGIDRWLERDRGGLDRHDRILQRGMGFQSLCEKCNNRTGSRYAAELVRWSRSVVPILADVDLAQLDDSPGVPRARWQARDVRPLLLAKQIACMALAISGEAMPPLHPELRRFVLDPDRRGLPSQYRFFLALYAGPRSRTAAGAGVLNVDRHEDSVLWEVAHPPFAYMLSIGNLVPVPVGEITHFASMEGDEQLDVEIDTIIGFGHTALPADFRTLRRIDDERAENLRAAWARGQAHCDAPKGACR